MPSLFSVLVVIFAIWFFFGDVVDAWLLLTIKEHLKRRDAKKKAKALADSMAKPKDHGRWRILGRYVIKSQSMPKTLKAPKEKRNYRIGRDAMPELDALQLRAIIAAELAQEYGRRQVRPGLDAPVAQRARALDQFECLLEATQAQQHVDHGVDGIVVAWHDIVE